MRHLNEFKLSYKYLDMTQNQILSNDQTTGEPILALLSQWIKYTFWTYLFVYHKGG